MRGGTYFFPLSSSSPPPSPLLHSSLPQALLPIHLPASSPLNQHFRPLSYPITTNPATDGVDVTAKAITHRIAKLRTAVNEEVDPKATPLGKPIIKHRKVSGVGEKRPAPKEEVKVKAVVDDGYVLLLVLSMSTLITNRGKRAEQTG